MDNFLNLSSSGNIIPAKGSSDITFNSFSKEIEKSKTMMKDKKELSNLVAYKVLMHTSQIKLFHWQTHSFAEHKALDKAFEKLFELGDELMESVMGKYGRPLLEEKEVITLTNYSEQKNCGEYLERMRKCYCDELRPMFCPKEDSELLNLVDEIIALFDKTMYLITLK